jgi:hypothetical protein
MHLMLMHNGAESRTRTDTVLLPRDFESRASTNFAISAIFQNLIHRIHNIICDQKVNVVVYRDRGLMAA